MSILFSAPLAHASVNPAHFSGAQSTIGSGLSSPYGVAEDGSGSVYIADSGNNRVLKETLSGGGYTQSTIGSGLAAPFDVAVDGSGNVYIADYGDSKVYKETLSGGSYTQSTVPSSPLSGPMGVTVDGSGNVYIADTGNNRVLMETLSGGSYTESTVPSSSLSGPEEVAVDGSGNVYIADTNNNRVLKETLSGGSYTESTVPSSGLSGPMGVAVDGSGNVYIEDTGNNRVLKETLSGGSYIESTVPSSGLNFLMGIAVDVVNGNVFLADANNSRVLLESPSGNFGRVKVGSSSANLISLIFAFDSGGTIGGPAVLTQGTAGLDFTDNGTGDCTTNGTSHAYSAGDTCAVDVIFTPRYPGVRLGAAEVRVVSDTTEVRDSGNNVLASGYVYGTGSGPQVNFVPGTESVIATAPGMKPQGLAVDGSGNVYIADYTHDVVLQVTPAGVQSTVASAIGGLGTPETVAVDGSGNVYVGDSGNSQILKETPSGSAYVQTTIANIGTNGLSSPGGVAVDGSGNVYIADTDNDRVLKETLLAGSYTQSTIPTSSLNFPFAVAVDGYGNVYIADSYNNRVLKETQSGSSYTENVVGSGLNVPTGVAVDGIGNVYIADYSNNRVLKETRSGTSYTQSTVPTSSLTNPFGVVVDGNGNIYLSDVGNARVLKENFAVAPNLSFASTKEGSTSSDSPQMVTVENIGNAALTFSVPGSGWNPSLSNDFTSTSASACPEVSSTGSSATLAANSSCIFELSFTPDTPGTISGALVLTDNALNVSGSTQSVQLSGTGIATTTAPTINWPQPSSIAYGTPLSATQLNATASVIGTFAYTPAAGTVLNAGMQILSVTFTPADTTDYNTVSASVTETVEDFSLTGGTATLLSATVMPGDTASYVLQFAPAGGSTFVDAVALTLTGLPAGATYTISPSTIPAGSGTTTVTVTVNTSTQQAAASSSPKGGIGFPKPLMLAIFLPLLGTRKLRRALRLQMKTSALMLVVLGVLMVTGMTACGNGSGFLTQSPQTYPMTLTGTSGALHHSVTINLTVQ